MKRQHLEERLASLLQTVNLELPEWEPPKERRSFFHSDECLMREGSDSVCSCDQYDVMQLHLQNMHEDEFKILLSGPVETDRVDSSSRASAHAKFVLSQFTHKHHVEKKSHLHYRCKLCTKEYFLHNKYAITECLGGDYGRLKKHLQKKHWDEAPIPLSVSVKTLHKRKVTRVSRYGGNSGAGDAPVFMTIDLPRNATILSVKQYLIERTSYAHMLDVVLLIGHGSGCRQGEYRQIASDDSVLSSDTRLLQLQIFDPHEHWFLYRASKTACTDSAVAADESPSSKWQCAHQYWDHLLAKQLQYPKLHEWNGSSPYFFSKQVVSQVKATRDFIAQSHFFARLQLASCFHSYS
jgi:hypothetical protein